MTDERVNIKVDESTRAKLKDGKPSGVTWDRYLRLLASEGVEVQRYPDEFPGDVTIEVDGQPVTLEAGESKRVEKPSAEVDGR